LRRTLTKSSRKLVDEPLLQPHYGYYHVRATKGAAMSFRDNLQHLRATRNMTQEQLAMLLGVSRQSVSKWEAEKANPEMDKLIKICEIFDCTLDDLVQGDLTAREPQPELSVSPAAEPTDVCGYDEVMLRSGRRIALGVAIIIAGVGLAGFLGAGHVGLGSYSLTGDAAAAVAMFGGVTAGLAFIIPAAFERSAFQKAHPFVEDFYTPEQKAEVHKQLGTRIVVGVALIMAALVCGAVFKDNEQVAAITFFLTLAVGVWSIVDGGLLAGRMNVEEYNDEALAELTDAEIEALDDPALARRARAKKREGGLYGAIMLTATAIALVWLFLGPSLGFERNDLMSYFWLPWPIGGITCGIVACVRNAR